MKYVLKIIAAAIVSATVLAAYFVIGLYHVKNLGVADGLTATWLSYSVTAFASMAGLAINFLINRERIGRDEVCGIVLTGTIWPLTPLLAVIGCEQGRHREVQA